MSGFKTATRKIHWCSGHRVMGHENKCAHLHGHNYTALITCRLLDEGEGVDKIGRVVDFSVIKDVFDGFVQAEWDHGFILSKHDRDARTIIGSFLPQPNFTGMYRPDQKLFIMDKNPTAENMAEYLGTVVAKNLPAGLIVTRVRVWETENCYADWENDNVALVGK